MQLGKLKNVYVTPNLYGLLRQKEAYPHKEKIPETMSFGDFQQISAWRTEARDGRL